MDPVLDMLLLDNVKLRLTGVSAITLGFAPAPNKVPLI